ncbi:MAG: transposase [Oscillochloris sp.]|nr:transposase [Oscillochloris sp.]
MHVATARVNPTIEGLPLLGIANGSRKIQVLLRPEFGTLARNTVRRYMQEMGIAAIYPGPNLSRRHLDHQISP